MLRHACEQYFVPELPRLRDPCRTVIGQLRQFQVWGRGYILRGAMVAAMHSIFYFYLKHIFLVSYDPSLNYP